MSTCSVDGFGASIETLSASEVEQRLNAALRRLDDARRDAVTWFSQILERRLYLALGYSSIQHYARERLGFSAARTSYFLRLIRAFDELPRLKESVSRGDVTWTKAREIVRVATPATEARWVEVARSSSRRELERKIAAVRGDARRGRRVPGQVDLLAGPRSEGDSGTGRGADPADPSHAVGGSAGPGGARGSTPDGARGSASDGARGSTPDGARGRARDGAPVDGVGEAPRETTNQARAPIQEVPVTVSLRFAPEQYARLEALMERARRSGIRGSREDLVLAGLESLGDGDRESGGVQGACGPEVREPAVLSPAAPALREPEPAEPALREPAPAEPTSRTFEPVEATSGEPEPAGPTTSGPERRDLTSGLPQPPVSAPRPPGGLPSRQSSGPRYQIIVLQCETCGKAELPTNRGDLIIDAATLHRIQCDARVHRPGDRNRASIPPTVRRRVLARDRNRCRMAGCGSTRFLDVHHITPRSAGGSNRENNLMTLCSACHGLVHARGGSAKFAGLLRIAAATTLPAAPTRTSRDAAPDLHPGEAGGFLGADAPSKAEGASSV